MHLTRRRRLAARPRPRSARATAARPTGGTGSRRARPASASARTRWDARPGRAADGPPSPAATDAVANICGGAALLASYQPRPAAPPVLAAGAAAVARYSGAATSPPRCGSRAGVTPSSAPAPRARPTTASACRCAAHPGGAGRPRRPWRGLGLAVAGHGSVSTARRARLRVGPRAVRAVRRRRRATTATTTSPTGPHDLRIDYIVIHDTEAPGTPRSSSSGPDVPRLALHGALVRRPRRPAHRPAGRRLARRQLVREHALDRRRARGLRRPGRDLVHRVALPELGGAGAPPRPRVRRPARPGPHHRPRPGAGHRSRPRRRHALGPGAVLGLGALHGPARAPRSRRDRRGQQATW